VKYLFRFSLQSLYEIFLILRRSERDVLKNANWSSCKEPIIIFRFSLALNFLARLSKITHIQFHDNPFSGSRVVPFGQTDGQADRRGLGISRFPQFCDFFWGGGCGVHINGRIFIAYKMPVVMYSCA
jgi:hypothetical protein